jgi:hypothetical protein
MYTKWGWGIKGAGSEEYPVTTCSWRLLLVGVAVLSLGAAIRHIYRGDFITAAICATIYFVAITAPKEMHRP